MQKKKLFFIILLPFFCITSCKKEGCTDSKAKNYNSKAQKDDGTCLYEDEEINSSKPTYIYTYRILDDFDSTGIEGIKILDKVNHGDPIIGPIYLYSKVGCTNNEGEWTKSYNVKKSFNPYSDCDDPYRPDGTYNKTAKQGYNGVEILEISDNYWLPETGKSDDIRTFKSTIYVKQYAYLDIIFDRVNQYDSIDSIQISINDVNYKINCIKPKGENPSYLDPTFGWNNPLYWRRYHIIKWKTKYDTTYNVDSVYIDDTYEYDYSITY